MVEFILQFGDSKESVDIEPQEDRGISIEIKIRNLGISGRS